MNAASGERPWRRFYDPGVPAEIEVPATTLPAWLEATAARFPRRAATVCFGRRRTWREVRDGASIFGGLLADLGVKPGDRVALLLPNLPLAVEAYYGALGAGAVVVQINPLGSGADMAHAIRDSGARVFVALDALLGRFADALPGLPLDHLLLASLAGELPLPLRAGFTVQTWLGRVPLPPRGAGEPLRARLARAQPLPAPVARGPEDVALLQYTGGTTGTPKAAVLTHRNLVANVEQCHAWLGGRPDGTDVAFLALPFFHVYGMTVGMNLAVRTAQTMILQPRFEPGAAMALIERHRATEFPGVQLFYQRIAEHPRVKRHDLSSVKICLSGAGPLMREVQERFEALTGARVVEGYGLTEASPVTHANPIYGRAKIGTIGLPFPSTDVKLVDLGSGETEAGPGEPGELCVRGPQVMREYWRAPAETKAVLRDGWLRTGDVAVMDEEGYFRIVDRKKEMIKTGGENVYPRDVEEALFRHPAVEDAGVVGVPDPALGERVKAFVVLKPGATASEADLLAHCRGLLAGFKTPKTVEFRTALPRTQVGKLLRRVLAEEERARGAKERA